MKFLVDSQLPPALARFLSSRGVDCIHVLDVDLASASDRTIWKYALLMNLIIISKDEDFLHMVNTSASEGRFVWIRVGNCSKRKLLADVESVWPKIEARLQAGERIVELR